MPDIPILHVILLIITGFLAGFVNTLAGGGSALTLSVLIFLGVPANVANGTNRIALLMQNIVAVSEFKRQKQLEAKKGFLLALPAVAGAAIGSYIAVDVSRVIIERAIAIILIVMLIMLFYKPQQWLEGNLGLQQKKLKWWLYPLFFILGIYAGFLHLGIGYAILASVVLGAGFDLVKANAIKLLVILLWTPLSIYIFYTHGQINLWYGLLLGTGNLSGALLATKMAVKRGTGFVRWVIVTVILITTLHLLGLF